MGGSWVRGLGLESKGAQGHLIDVGLAIGESIVGEDDGGGGSETKDDGTDGVAGESKCAADDAALFGKCGLAASLLGVDAV